MLLDATHGVPFVPLNDVIDRIDDGVDIERAATTIAPLVAQPVGS